MQRSTAMRWVALLFLFSCATIDTRSPACQPDQKVAATNSDLLDLQDRLRAVDERVRDAVVRVDTVAALCSSGVIVTPEGHVLTRSYSEPGQTIPLQLADGKPATAVTLGWSDEWGISMLKIEGPGPWPHVELATASGIAIDDYCVGLGYAPRSDAQYDQRPSLRLGQVNLIHGQQWLTTTCVSGPFEFGQPLFDLDGRLIGLAVRLGPNHTEFLATDVVKQLWDPLLEGRNLDWLRYPPAKESYFHIGDGLDLSRTGIRRAEEVLGAAEAPGEGTARPASPEALETAKRCTVRIRSNERLAFDGKDFDRWSGVVVSKDGYVLTCAHTDQLPGEKVTILFSDGRDAQGVVLGSNRITDVGLVRITDAGPWPHTSMADSSRMRPGDAAIVAGYPAQNKARDPQIDQVEIARTPFVIWGLQLFTTRKYVLYGGMSGGGIFNADGHLVAVHLAGGNTRTEVARAQWDELAATETMRISSAEPFAELQQQFASRVQPLAAAVVTILVDEQAVALGTIVGKDGWIATKASELTGDVHVRLENGDQRPATVVAVSRPHDLALLKIDAADLSTIAWSDAAVPEVGGLVAAVLADQQSRLGVVSTGSRPLAAEPAWRGEGLENTDQGPRLTRRLNIRFQQPLRSQDVIVAFDGSPVPNRETFSQLVQAKTREMVPGDLIEIRVRRDDQLLDFQMPLLPSMESPYPFLDGDQSPRRSGFPAVFDTDLRLTRELCGGPVIDAQGHVIGLVIASRGRFQTHRGPSCILPASLAAGVIDELRASAEKVLPQ